MSDKPCKATPPDELLEQLLDCRVPKTEREHFAASKIEQLQAELAEAKPVLDAATRFAHSGAEDMPTNGLKLINAVSEYKEE
jgi:hypothetical protein